jgi:hypothetical protein
MAIVIITFGGASFDVGCGGESDKVKRTGQGRASTRYVIHVNASQVHVQPIHNARKHGLCRYITSMLARKEIVC